MGLNNVLSRKLVTSGSKLVFFHLFALLSKGMWSSPSVKPAICHAHFDMDSFLPAIHPTPSHLVTPLHLALTILPPSSTLPFASPFSLLAPMAFYAFSAPTSFFLGLLFTNPQGLVWTFPHGILLITHAHHQPVVPAEHKGTRNLHMPPGASETYGDRSKGPCKEF